MGRKRQFITLFLFAILVVANTSSWHIFSHDDGSTANIENCSFCQLAVLTQEFEFDQPAVEVAPGSLYEEVSTPAIQEYSPVWTPSPIPSSLFSRPPPAV